MKTYPAPVILEQAALFLRFFAALKNDKKRAALRGILGRGVPCFLHLMKLEEQGKVSPEIIQKICKNVSVFRLFVVNIGKGQ